ncbi:MAG: transcriptional regulator, partial [Acidobacteriaceae bacterium]
GADEIVLRVADHWIRFTHNRMEDSLGNSIPFSLDEDGRARLDNRIEEMDLAAERLAREMMQSE